MHLIEVSNNIPFIHMMTTDNILQNPPSDKDRLVEWGLTSNDVTFIRRSLKTLLFEYILRGEASVELRWILLKMFISFISGTETKCNFNIYLSDIQ